MQIIKDLIPFHNETIGSERIRKFLGLALIVGLLQTFSWTYQIVEAPKVLAAQTYGPNDATGTFIIPTGVDTITADVVGGGGGWGGKDGSGNTNPSPGARGRVTVSFKVTAGQYLGIWPGAAGTNGTDGANNSGHGTGGTSSYSSSYNGGDGGDAGSAGGSGGGGGGGAASLLTIGSTIVAVAGGSGGGGGQSNAANTGQPGKDDATAINNSTNGGTGVKTSTTNSASSNGNPPCNRNTNDGGGGGGGGGGYQYGGAGGQIINGASGECAGDGGYRGQNYISNSVPFVAFNTTNSTISTSNTAAGYITIAYYLSTPSNFSATPTANVYGSISASWDTSSASSAFDVKLYDSTGSTLFLTKRVAAGNYSTTITSSDFASISNGTSYKLSVTAIGNGTLSFDSTESTKFTVTTNAAAGRFSDTDTAISLDGSSNNHLSISDNSGVSIPDTFTAEAWIYPTSFACKGGAASTWNSNDGYCHIISKGGYFSIITATTTNSTDAGVSAGQLGFIWGSTKFSKYVLNLNEWHHVAFSREGSSSGQAKLYVDGNLVLSDTAATNSSNSTRDFTIGATRSDSADSNSIYGKFIGQIDEVKLSSRYRSQAEIQYDLHHHNVSDSSFKLYYDFNENSGSKVFNRAAGAVSATDLNIIGSASFDTKKIYEIDTTTATAYTVVKFYRDYLVNANGWRSPANISSIRYLVVGGGGGGGGGWNGGGGGAGGYRETNTTISANTIYNIEIGVGGLGALYSYAPQNGGGSVIRNNSVSTESITASGGGSGATEQNVVLGPITGATSGGSGGGGVHGGGTTPGSGNSGGFTPVEGYQGGNGASLANVYAGGGGGGAGGVGGDASSSTTGVPGNGGSGVTTYITGTAVSIAGGGAGAGRYAPSVTYAKHGSATHGGGSGSCNDPCTGNDTGTAGTANRGGGGGAGAAAASGGAMGGNGGSGFIVIKYITNKPTIITQPVSDTSTVGAVDTFTITTSDAPAPLTKSVKWQFNSDTVTVSNSSWTDVSTGTGYTTDTFTTAALTKSMNKYRYRAIVTFSDTATITSIETSSVVTLTINDSITITSDTSTITRKYGDTQTVRTLSYTGGTTSTGAVGTSTSHSVNTPYGALANNKIRVDTSTSTAKLYVDTGTAVGTYYETITVTDYKGAVSSYTQKVIVNPADTLTVRADTLTAITYNPNGMIINPTVTFTGLVNSDTKSAITITFISTTSATCAQGGMCNLGDTGPGGGTIFYDAGSTQYWGRYIEASPIDWYTVANGGNGTENVSWCSNTNYLFTDLVDAIGYGLSNKANMNTACDSGSLYKNTAAGMVQIGYPSDPGGYAGGGKNDWFLPSLSEMDALNNYAGGSLLPQKYYWVAQNTSATVATTPAYSCCGGSWPYRAIGGASKSDLYPIRPMRYVTPDATLSSYNSTTPPNQAGTYLITPSALVLANNIDTSNYVSLIYQSSTFIIKSGIQDSLTISSKLGSYNGGTSTMKLTTTGGSDIGAVSYAIVSGGTASGCSISTNVLSYTSAGTCKVIATKAATTNYLIAYSDTVTITLSAFINRQQTQTQTVPTQLPINGANALDTSTVTIPDVTSVTSTGPGTYTILGTGFTGVTSVTIGGTSVTIAISTSTSIYISGAWGLSGPLMIECTGGRIGPVPFWLIL